MTTQVQAGQSSTASDVTRGTLAPHNEDAERAVLAAMLVDKDAALQAVNLVRAGDFYRERHAVLFAAMQRLQGTGVEIDPLTLPAELEAAGDLKRAGDREYIASLLDEVPTTSGLPHWAKLVREAAERRRLLQLGRQLQAAALDAAISLDQVRDVASRQLLAAVEGEAGQGFRPVRHYVEQMLQRLQALEDNAVPAGLLTGWPELDDRLNGGFQPGDLVLVVGVPSSGKTSFMVNLLVDAARRGAGSTALVSAEMKGETVARNITAMLSDVPVAVIRSGQMDGTQRRAAMRGAVEQARVAFEIDDTDTPTIEDLIVRCTLLKARRPDLTAVGVDFLQMIQRRERERGESEELALERTAYDLKGLAKRLGIVVFAAVQPNDKQVEDREDKRPQLRDIARSSGPRRAADVALLIYRPGQYSPSAGNDFEINIAKFREGALGKLNLEWEGQFVRVNSPRRRAALAEAEASRHRQFEMSGVRADDRRENDRHPARPL